MMRVRKSEDRGSTHIGGLGSKHSFSFGGYRDPEHMGFSNLLVIDEDKVAPGAGFGRHGHADLEIPTYVLEGALGHRDSTGTDGVIRAGEIQRMSAGHAIQHSEMNERATKPVHLLQVWIKPCGRDIAPGYEQVAMPAVTTPAQRNLIAGPRGGPGAVMRHADASLRRTSLAPGASPSVPLAPGRRAWVQVTRGAAAANGETLARGDGLAVSGESALNLAGTGGEPAELLVFDLA